MITNRKAVIFGISSYRLTYKEKIFLKKNKPWGIILFSRNIQSLVQLKALIKDIKKIFKDEKFPILIDVEGGKVSRFEKIIDLSTFSQNYFAELYKKNKKLFFNSYKTYINSLSNIFNHVGININTVPVLDVTHPKTSKVIGTRSYSTNSSTVSAIGDTCINYFWRLDSLKSRISCRSFYLYAFLIVYNFRIFMFLP